MIADVLGFLGNIFIIIVLLFAIVAATGGLILLLGTTWDTIKCFVKGVKP